MSKPFQFKQFHVAHDKCAMKVGTDGVLLGAWTTVEGNRILDIGTGSGLIALMIAQRNKNAVIDAVEVNKAAYEQAKQNFVDSPWAERLNCYNSNILDFNPGHRYDVIVSNPPFFIKSTPAPDKERHLVRHNDLLPLQLLIDQVNQSLLPDGKFNVIVPPEEAEILRHYASMHDLYPERITSFIPRINKKTKRLLMTFSYGSKEVHVTELLHYNIQNEWTRQYKELTQEFYSVL